MRQAKLSLARIPPKQKALGFAARPFSPTHFPVIEADDQSLAGLVQFFLLFLINRHRP
jgi:hypothetical protein